MNLVTVHLSESKIYPFIGSHFILLTSDALTKIHALKKVRSKCHCISILGLLLNLS